MWAYENNINNETNIYSWLIYIYYIKSKQRNPNGSNNTPLKRKTVKFNCDVPWRFLKNKSKQTIPQTTRNSQRKILLDYGNSNFLLEKEIKLKSRRNSKKVNAI